MYKKPLHEELSRYKAWKYACHLFNKSLVDKPHFWLNHYMIGKCLWKMFNKAVDEWDAKDRASRPSVQSVLNAFVKAIRTAPKQKDSRQEPILEPHYKLVSVVHKLVMLKEMEMQDAANLLQQQPYAILKGEPVTITNLEEWDAFILDSLRHLRNADKQHWHHRMVARVADILYDNEKHDYVQALAARTEFRESIFTKTMHIQVWKTETERAGRHCVYMSRYVRAMFQILITANDKTNMEQLVRRVKKKANDFFKFNEVWTDCCSAYLRLIRRSSNIPTNMDEVFKGISTEEFDLFSDRLTQWIADPNMTHPALDALRETIELKKLNANTMKSAPIDDMINDAWAALYTQVGKSLPGPDPSVAQAQPDGPADTRMSLNNLVMNMDGSPASGVPVPVEPARPRKIGISRREVLRRAEGAITRAPEPPRPLAPGPQPRPSPSLILGSNTVPSRNDTSSSTKKTEVSAKQVIEKAGDGTPRSGNGTPRNGTPDGEEREESEAPGSVHDSADDESDLSDVPDMDDAESAMIFPNLIRNSVPGPGSSGGEGSTPAKDS